MIAFPLAYFHRNLRQNCREYSCKGLLLVWLLGDFGIDARVALDSVLLLVVAHRLLPALAAPLRQVFPLVLVPLPLFLAGAMLDGLAAKAAFFCLSTVTIASAAYLFSCSQAERQTLKAGMRSFFEPSGSR